MDVQTNITSLLVLLSVGVSVGVIVLFYESLSSLFSPKASLQGMTSSVSDQRRERLLLEKDGLLRALQDLESDFGSGKTRAEDFDNERKAIVQKLLAIKKRLDKEIEGERKEAKKILSKAFEVTEEIAEKSSLPVCSSCQTTNDEDATFCKKCGTKLVLASEEEDNNET